MNIHGNRIIIIFQFVVSEHLEDDASEDKRNAALKLLDEAE